MKFSAKVRYFLIWFLVCSLLLLSLVSTINIRNILPSCDEIVYASSSSLVRAISALSIQKYAQFYCLESSWAQGFAIRVLLLLLIAVALPHVMCFAGFAGSPVKNNLQHTAEKLSVFLHRKDGMK